MTSTINVNTNILINKLFEYVKHKQYTRIHQCISYIRSNNRINNRYGNHKDTIYNYIHLYSQEECNYILEKFYKSVQIYTFIVRQTRKKKKKIYINDHNLYGVAFIECKEPIIYLQSDTKNKYYVFTYSELNKIITQALLFTFENEPIISSQYPKHPWTNIPFTNNQLEYIVYKFRHLGLHCHKVIRMFADSNFNITTLTEQYEYYLYKISISLYINTLDKKKLKELLQYFWLFMTKEYTYERTKFPKYIKYTRLREKICKQCLMSISTIQTELNSILTEYYISFHKSFMFSNDDILAALKFKKKIYAYLEDYYPYIFKHTGYYHLHYNKYIGTIPSPFFRYSIQLPIQGFTDDCKIIYNDNGVHCIRAGQILIAI